MARVRIGAMHWELPGWDRFYYPPDLPVDWRLNYYANDFLVVAVPLSPDYSESDWERLLEMLEDCHDDFLPLYYLQELPRDYDWLERLGQDNLDVWLDLKIGLEISAVSEFQRQLSTASKLHITLHQEQWLEVAGVLPENIFPVADQTTQDTDWLSASRLLVLNEKLASRELASHLQLFLDQQTDAQDSIVLAGWQDCQAADIEEIQTIISLLGN